MLERQAKIVTTFKTLLQQSIKKKAAEFVATFQIYGVTKNKAEGSKQCHDIVLKQQQKSS